jgi:hypothetical protein
VGARGRDVACWHLNLNDLGERLNINLEMPPTPRGVPGNFASPYLVFAWLTDNLSQHKRVVKRGHFTHT